MIHFGGSPRSSSGKCVLPVFLCYSPCNGAGACFRSITPPANWSLPDSYSLSLYCFYPCSNLLTGTTRWLPSSTFSGRRAPCNCALVASNSTEVRGSPYFQSGQTAWVLCAVCMTCSFDGLLALLSHVAGNRNTPHSRIFLIIMCIAGTKTATAVYVVLHAFYMVGK